MDVDKIVSRVDVEQIIERVDVEKIIQRVDIDALVEQTELGTIIARSTSGVASEALDLVRAQGVGLDDFLARWVNRILRRNSGRMAARSTGPGHPPLAGIDAPCPAAGRCTVSASTTASAPPIAGRQGHYAGGVTRLVAFAADVGASWGVFTVALAGITFAIHLVTGTTINPGKGTISEIIALVPFVVWEFIYFAYQWSLSGKTVGMALLGIRVVGTDGEPITGRQAVIRTLTLPLSFLLLGLGLHRHPVEQGPARAARPVRPDRRRLLVGRTGGPAAVAGQAGVGHPVLTVPVDRLIPSAARGGGARGRAPAGWLDADLRVELVERCRAWGEASGGPRSPRMRNGSSMSVEMVGLGWHWYPYRYSRTRDDGDGGRGPAVPPVARGSGPAGRGRRRGRRPLDRSRSGRVRARCRPGQLVRPRGEDGDARRQRRGEPGPGGVLQRRTDGPVPVRQHRRSGPAVGRRAAGVGGRGGVRRPGTSGVPRRAAPRARRPTIRPSASLPGRLNVTVRLTGLPADRRPIRKREVTGCDRVVVDCRRFVVQARRLRPLSVVMGTIAYRMKQGVH